MIYKWLTNFALKPIRRIFFVIPIIVILINFLVEMFAKIKVII